jgi:hypothetical protein
MRTLDIRLMHTNNRIHQYMYTRRAMLASMIIIILATYSRYLHVHTASERAFLVVCTASYYELYYCTLPRCHRRPHSSVPEVSRTYSTRVFAVISMLGRHASGMYDFISLSLSFPTIIPLTSTPFLAYHPPTSLHPTATGPSSAVANRHSSALSLPDTPAANRCSPTSFSLLDNTHTLPNTSLTLLFPLREPYHPFASPSSDFRPANTLPLRHSKTAASNTHTSRAWIRQPRCCYQSRLFSKQ